MARNSCFGQIMEEGSEPAFFKILQRKDLFSETMRGIPQNFIKSISDKELSGKMILKLPWGISWSIKISRNPMFYYMEKTGWEQFLRHNGLGNDEFLTFTHKGNMCFSVSIFRIDGKEMLNPTTIASSSRRNKRDQRKDIYKDVKTEEIESLSDTSYPVQKTAEPRLRQKRELRLGKKKTEDSKKKKKKKVDTSSIGAEFNVSIANSYLHFLGIPKKFMDMHMPKETKMFKIHHHSKENKSWEVNYTVTNAQSKFSAGWTGLARELDLVVGDVCTFKLIKPTEMLLKVSKGRFHDDDDDLCETEPMEAPARGNLRAVALIAGDNNVRGCLQFLQDTSGTTHVTGKITGLSPGFHGFHIHSFGDTTNGCNSTGPHFNPLNRVHGAPDEEERHAGDLGNILAGSDGVAEISIKDIQIPLSGQHSIIGRAVVVHAEPDDLGKGGHKLSKSTGNAGARVGCGIIGLQSSVDTKL